MSLFSSLLPDWVAETVAALFGYFARLVRFRSDENVEKKVRGVLLGPRFGARGAQIGRNVLFHGPGRIRIGRGVSINAGSQFIAGATGKIIIGDHSHVSRNSVLAGAGGIEIGDYTMISSGVMIYTVTYDRANANLLRDAPSKLLPVRIGNDVHIGANATILPGVMIGDNATIGAGAVVTRDVAAGVTVIGVPARPVSTSAPPKLET